MLRYIEGHGLIDPPRSDAGYRLYGAAELQRLRTLRELLARFGASLGDIGFAARLRDEGELSAAVDTWFEAEPERPADASDDADWLRWEQDKHQKLLGLAEAR